MSEDVATVRSLLSDGRLAEAVSVAEKALRSNERRANWGALFFDADPLPWSVLRALREQRGPAEAGLADALNALSADDLIPKVWTSPRSRLLIQGALRCVLHAVAPDTGPYHQEAVAAYDEYFGSGLGGRIVASVARAGRVIHHARTVLLMHGAGDLGAVRLFASHRDRVDEPEPPCVLPDITRFGFPDLDGDFLAAVGDAARFVRVRGWHTAGTIYWYLSAAEIKKPIEGRSGWGSFVAVFRAAAESVDLNDRTAVIPYSAKSDTSSKV